MAESDWLADAFPLPFRVLTLILFGVLCFATNLDLLKRVQVHPATLLCAPGDLHGLSSHRMYRMLAILSVLTFMGWLWYALALANSIIAILYFTLFLLLINPLPIFYPKDRFKFLKTIKRIVFQGIFSPVYFGDVILADILTSFAKVFADIYLVACGLFFYSGDLFFTAMGNSVSISSQDHHEVCHYDYVGQCCTSYAISG